MTSGSENAGNEKVLLRAEHLSVAFPRPNGKEKIVLVTKSSKTLLRPHTL